MGRDPYWPCIIYNPELAPQKNKCLAAWSKKGPKRENFYICMWFGYGSNLNYSCISKKNLLDWQSNKDQLEKTNGGKKKMSAKELASFKLAIEEASAENGKPKRDRLQELHLELAKQKKKRRRLPPVEKLVGRRLSIKDPEGESFLGEIVEAKTGTSKEGAENVTLVRIVYDDGETDSELDLATESFDWAPAKKATKMKKSTKAPEKQKQTSASESSSDESDSDSSSSEDSDSEYSESDDDETKPGSNKSSNSEERGVKKRRAYERVNAFFKQQFSEEGI